MSSCRATNAKGARFQILMMQVRLLPRLLEVCDDVLESRRPQADFS